MRSREESDPGVGPHCADPAHAAGAAGQGHPRLRASRHHYPVRGARGGHRTGHRRFYERHRHQEFLAFLKLVARTYPRVQLHLVCDNYGTHQHPEVKAWLAKHPRITLHFTPTSGSWLNMVEIFFGMIIRQAIRRGTFTSVKELIAAIGRFIDGWNDRCEPFVWTKTAHQLLCHNRRQKTSFMRH